MYPAVSRVCDDRRANDDEFRSRVSARSSMVVAIHSSRNKFMPRRLRFAFQTCLIMTSLMVASQSRKAAADDAAVIAELKQIIAQQMADKELPCISIALVRDGEVVWSSGFGVADSVMKATGQKLAGYLAPALTHTERTMDLLAEYGFLYTCDLFQDDTPLKALNAASSS